MLFTTRTNNLVTAQPRLSRIWIKTGDPKTPLKAVWMNELQLSRAMGDTCASMHDYDSAEMAEEHSICAWIAVWVRAFAWRTGSVLRLRS